MASKISLTPDRIRKFPHPGKGKKSFLWDSKCSGLGVVATTIKKNFIYQGRFGGKTIRITIGETWNWTVEDARIRAMEFAQLIDKGIDPREEKKRSVAIEEKSRAESDRKNITVGEIWPIYIKERKANWSERHYLDHIRLAHLGGQKKKRGGGETVPGALASLMQLKLSELTEETVKSWIARESATRKTQTRIGFEALRAFLNWCDDKKKYKGLASPDACSAKVKKNNLPKRKAKDDCLQKEQLPSWFKAVASYHNKVISAYLQTVLLTGARREEVASVEWKDVDFKWKSMTIKDKVEGERVIPLTPYIAAILSGLPRRNKWVFSSPTAEDGRLKEPRISHNKCLAIAGIDRLTIHGLRRSFGTLSEWVEMPVGIVYQIQGHKPSATAEKHYRKRPLDLLRMWHVKLEAWILEQASIQQPDYKDIRTVKLKKIG